MAKSKLYTATFTLPDGRRKYVRAKTKEELERKVTQLKMEMRAGVDISDNTTFGEFVQMWVDTYKRPNLTEKSLTDLLHILNNVVMPTLAPMRLRDIKPMHIIQMMSARPELSHRTQSKALSYTRSIFNAAVDNGLIVRSPVPTTLKAKGAPTEQKVPLTEEQCDRLLEAVRDERIYPAVVTMLGLGLRREEALALMWNDIDFDAHYAHICRTNVFFVNESTVSNNMKSAAALRDIPLPPWVEAELLRLKAESTSLYVAPSANGGPMTPSSFKSAWGAIKRRTANEPSELNTAKKNSPWAVRTLDFHVHPHLLRHTCATRWIEQGFTPKEVQYMLGHSSPDITMGIYAHYDRAGQFDATVAKMRAQS